MAKKLDIVNLKGETVKTITLKDSVFNVEVNDATVHNAVVKARAGARQGTHATKTRSEVRGGGAKPFKQKGTGNARQGSIRAVQFVGGGIAFGPKPRDYSKGQNKKERRLALKSALTYKATDKELILIDKINFDDAKTKNMVNLLETLDVRYNKVLIVVEELVENVCLSSRNLANIKVVTPNEINTYDVVCADNMLIEEAALNKIQEVLA